MTEPSLYVGQKFEFFGLPGVKVNQPLQTDEETGQEYVVLVPSMLVEPVWPETDRHVEIVSISVTGNVCFRINVVDDPDLARQLHSIPVERVALMRSMGFWRSNSVRWPLQPGGQE